MDLFLERIDKKFNLFCVILDCSHVLILLNIKKDHSRVAEVATAFKIILMTATKFLTNMRFSRDNDCNTLNSSSKLMGSHSKTVGSS